MKKAVQTDQLYGLRALAIALVVASHARLLSQGGLGNSMMFAMSGFLAIEPFAETELMFGSAADVGRYYLHKLRNILPAYWTVVLVVKFLTGTRYFSWKGLLRCMFFIECPGEFWFVQMIMIMYLLTPPVILLFRALTRTISDDRKKYTALTVLSVILAVFAGLVLARIPFHIMGNGADQPLRLYLYAIGMASGYFYRYLGASGVGPGSLSRRARTACGAAAIVLFVLAFASSNYFLAKIDPDLQTFYVGWNLSSLCSALTGVMMILLLVHSDGIIARLMASPPASALGKVSFEIYLIHWFMIELCELNIHPYRNFVILYLVSASISYALHYFIVPYIKEPRRLFRKMV